MSGETRRLRRPGRWNRKLRSESSGKDGSDSKKQTHAEILDSALLPV